jgi:SRSO17 transposase
MVEPRQPRATVEFVDEYCQTYQNLFGDVRNYEYLKFLHIGMMSELPRKSLPQIARIVGLKDGQGLHHLLRDAVWDVEALREMRLWLTKVTIGEQPITVCIDETGDEKKGKATDYVAKQYIGNLGRTANGIVSVNAYAVVDNITYPLLFKVFKPRSTLQEKDKYKTKPQLAVEILQELRDFGFNISLVLADRLYGESGDVIGALVEQKLPFIVAIRSNHVVWLSPQQRVRYNRWQAYEQKLSHRSAETRYIREIIFGKRRELRYFEITKSDSKPDSSNTWFIMTNIQSKIQQVLGQLYSLRNWIEYGFKQVKNQLGWADFRLTDYHSIERWWEIVFSTYLLVSLHTLQFKLSELSLSERHNSNKESSVDFAETTKEFSQHVWWEPGANWKSALNNLRLIIQPYIFWCLIAPWLEVFQISGLQRGFSKLIEIMNDFRASPIEFALAN